MLSDAEKHRVEEQFEEAAAKDGMILVLPDEDSARRAWQDVAEFLKGRCETRVVKDLDDLEPIVLTPTEPQVTRTQRILYGVVIGTIGGVAIAAAVNAMAPAGSWNVFAVVALGAVLGVLWGATIAGLGAPPYRDDSIEELKHHLDHGRVLVLTICDKERLRELEPVVSRHKPIVVIASENIRVSSK